MRVSGSSRAAAILGAAGLTLWLGVAPATASTTVAPRGSGGHARSADSAGDGPLIESVLGQPRSALAGTFPAAIAAAPRQVGTSSTPRATQPADTLPAPGTFVPVPPVRLIDTRPSLTYCGNLRHSPLAGGSSMTVLVGMLSCGNADAMAVVLNVTVTGATAPTYITVYPVGSPRPTTSILNPVPGQTVSVLTTVALGGPQGGFNVYNARGSVNVIIDITGYYTPLGEAQQSLYHSQAPSRALDTRTSTAGPLRSHYFTWIGLSIPQTTAVALNVTVTGGTAGGYLVLWPGNKDPTTIASSLNFAKGQTTANMAVVGTNPDSRTTSATKPPTFSILNGSPGSVHVIVDIVGWYTKDATLTGGQRFHSLAPTRIVDSRIGQGVAHPLGTNESAVVDTPQSIGDPDTGALVGNLTVLAGPHNTVVSLYPGDQAPPLASSLDVGAGHIASNMVMPSLSLSLHRSFAVRPNTGPTNVLVDVVGYFETDAVRLPPTPTTTTLQVSTGGPSTISFEAPVTLTATVTAGTGGVPGGTVRFFDVDDNGTWLADLPVASAGPTTMTTAALVAGTHHFRATFVPNRWFLTSSSATSSAVTVTAPGYDQAVTSFQDAMHDDFAPSTHLAKPLHLLWSKALGQYLPAALVADGKVFVGKYGLFMAYDQRTGAAIWGPASNVDETRPVVYDGGRLFVYQVDHTVAAMDAATGDVLWSTRRGNGDLVVPLTARNGVLYTQAGNGYLEPVSEVDGSVEWSQWIGGVTAPSVVVDSSDLLVTRPCGEVDSFNGDGTLAWTKTPDPCNSGGVAVLHGGLLYVTPGTFPTGNVWSVASESILRTFTSELPPAFDAQHGYLAAGPVVTAVDGTGATVWTWTGGNTLVAIVATADAVVAETADGVVTLLDPVTGHVQRSVSMPVGEEPVYLAIGQDTLVVESQGTIEAFGP